MSINIADYWPRPTVGTAQVSTVGNTILQYWFDPSNNAYRMDEWQNGQWADAWIYKFDSVRGVLEFRDVQSGGKVVNYVAGKEIPWGGVVNYGDMLSVPCQQSGFLAAHGQQVLMFDEGPEILGLPTVQITNVQIWSAALGFSAGVARYYMAPGVGFVGFDFVGPPLNQMRCTSITTGALTS